MEDVIEWETLRNRLGSVVAQGQLMVALYVQPSLLVDRDVGPVGDVLFFNISCTRGDHICYLDQFGYSGGALSSWPW